MTHFFFSFFCAKYFYLLNFFFFIFFFLLSPVLKCSVSLMRPASVSVKQSNKVLPDQNSNQNSRHYDLVATPTISKWRLIAPNATSARYGLH